MAHETEVRPDRVRAARAVVTRNRSASASALGRGLKTSWREADRLLDALAAEGVVSGAADDGRRAVLRA